jgi:hypothetical protein
MIYAKATLLALLLSVSAWAGPILVGGGGESEYSLIFLRENLSQIMQDCFAVTCGLTDVEKSRLAIFQQKSKNPPKLVFKTQDEMERRLFELKSKDNEVWINQDELWLNEDKTIAYGISDAAALWIQILQQGEAIAQDDVARLTLSLEGSLVNQVIRYAAELNDGETFELLSWKGLNQNTRLFIRDPFVQNFELTEKIRNAIHCSSSPIENMSIYSANWVSMTPTNEKLLVFNVGFGLKWTCGQKKHNQTGNVLISAMRDNADVPFQFDPNTIRVVIDDSKQE